MEIKDIRPDPAGAASPVLPIRDDARRMPDGTPEPGPVRDADRIVISGAGRATVHGGADASSSAFAVDRLMDVRRRVQSRYYDTPEVAEQVARRIIERGDL